MSVKLLSAALNVNGVVKNFLSICLTCFNLLRRNNVSDVTCFIFLIDKVVTVLSEKFPSSGVLIRQRHLGAVSLARDSVNCALNMLQDESAVFELASEELRRALHQLEMLVGRVDVENILDEIFSSFCLGK